MLITVAMQQLTRECGMLTLECGMLTLEYGMFTLECGMLTLECHPLPSGIRFTDSIGQEKWLK